MNRDMAPPLILTTAEARTLRALRVSGRRLIRTPDCWHVHARGDARTRPLATLDHASTARLVAAGRLRETERGGLILASTPDLGQDAPLTPRASLAPAPTRAFLLATHACTTIRAPGFLGLARKAERGEGPLSPRHVRAGLMLIKQAEASIRQSGLVMDPASPMRDRDARRSWSGGGVDAGARARTALRTLRAHITERDYRFAWAACVDARSLKWLAAHFDIPRTQVGPQMALSLEQVADGYGL